MATTHVKGIKPAETPPDENLTTRLWQRAAAGSSKQILRYWDGSSWRGMTWPQVADRVRDLAAALVAAGLEPGDRVAVMSGTRLDWTLIDLAILSAGGVTVPIYETSSAEQCAWILSDSEAKMAFAAEADHAKTLEIAREQAPSVTEVVMLADGGLDEFAGRATDELRGQVEARAGARTHDDLFSIIYTSGTTGNPKGCQLTHGNMLWTARQSGKVLEKLLESDDDCTLLFLPLAHVFARLVQYMCLELDVTIGYARSVETLQEDLRTFRPTFLLAVPRVFEKVFNGAQRKATGVKAKIFDFAVSSGREWSEAKDEGRDPGGLTNLKHGVSDKLVYSKLRDAMGGRMHYCVSGGAPLAPHLAHFFHAAGVIILEGYGLTETSAPATVNTPEARKIGTVGQPLPGVEIKVADDGEILIKGDNIFPGYFKNEEASREVLSDDGWFHSGDIGELDDRGFLKITGRKKEIIVTAGGKNVAPAVLEERLKSHRLISQAMVVGDNRAFIGALIALDPDELQNFAKDHDLTGPAAELSQRPEVQAEVQKAVDHANAAVSRAESIRKTVVLERDFLLEENEITPTLKLRRKVIAEHFADEIESLYAK